MPPADRITVTGTARREVTPDIAAWDAVTDAVDETQRGAFAACSARLAALLEAVRAAAPDGASVAAGGVWVTPEWDERGKRRVGYRAVASVGIRAPLADAAALGQAALDAGAVRLDGPRYEVSGLPAIRAELRAEAVADARRIADGMAAAEGRIVGRARRITDASPGHQPPWTPRARAAHVAMDAQADVPPVEPAAEPVEAAATVRFDLD